ncbi:hypothetical protein [Paenibacillus chungangensis]|uniref:Uncharacterized protein n=1 Tax=Paenibacillus chungangensis TaxID=696535 RepID=A0ABW3HMB9_9BACL
MRTYHCREPVWTVEAGMGSRLKMVLEAPVSSCPLIAEVRERRMAGVIGCLPAAALGITMKQSYVLCSHACVDWNLGGTT